MPEKTTAQRHHEAANALEHAVAHIQRALDHEGPLEWTGRIRELLHEARHVRDRLRVYAEAAKEEARHLAALVGDKADLAAITRLLPRDCAGVPETGTGL